MRKQRKRVSTRKSMQSKVGSTPIEVRLSDKKKRRRKKEAETGKTKEKKKSGVTRHREVTNGECCKRTDIETIVDKGCCMISSASSPC